MTHLTARYATPAEIAVWNTHILRNPDGGSIFASKQYAEIKKLTAYTPRFLFAGEIAVTVLEKNTPPLGKLWYIPKGPGVQTAAELLATATALTPIAKKAGAFVVRFETELPKNAEDALRTHGLLPAKPIIPNASTILLDISPPIDDILTSLPQKGRHAIRRAERDGVTVKQMPITSKNARVMYALLAETAAGQFGIRSYNYYKTYWETFTNAGLGQLFFAYYNGEVVAGAYAMAFGTKSTYKDGASIRQRTAYGASHLLQWQVIQWAKQQGATIHDFCGSPPTSEIDNPKHPHYGIGRFKQSFSKQVVDYIGCYDLVISASKYRAWNKLFERVHKSIYLRRTKDYYY